MRLPISFPGVTRVLLAAALLAVSVPVHAALTGPAAGDPADIARAYLEAHHAELGLTAADVSGAVLESRYTSEHNGVTHLYFVQTLDGIEVAEGVLNVNVSADGSILNLGNRFHGDLAGSAPFRQPTVAAATAVQAAASHLGLTPPASVAVVESIGGPSQEVVFAPSGISRRDIPAGLVWQSIGPGRARLAWRVAIEPDEDHYWEVAIDANDARALDERNLVVSDSYRVYPLPLESPNHHPTTAPPLDGRSVVGTVGAPGVSPADSTASPNGWHDTPSGPPPAAIPTSGNNVIAYTDTTMTDSPDPGDPPVSLTGDFDYPIDLTQGPETYQDALVTNLFYWTNVVHDLSFHYGFTEAAGNFQLTNYTGSGLGNDLLKAEAQDGSGTNNANMLTLRDGVPPRMQMFIFTPPFNAEVVLNNRAGGPYTGAAAGFGPPLPPTGLTADVVLVDDGAAAPSTSDACEPITQDLSGKIALVDRGSCNFTVKVQNCQNAGASGVIVVNNVDGNPITMGSTSPEPTIITPSLMISKASGAELKGFLPGVNATMQATANPPPNRDSDFDNGVIIHEYGHGISIRLTGGPAQTCLSGPEQMGEGWSDWFALVMTQQSGIEAAGGRGIGTYLTFQDPPEFGGGIRPFPYSTDPSVNSQTYGDLTTGALSVPHGVGTVWSSALWDLYWNLVRGVEVPEWGVDLPGLGWKADLYDRSAPLAGNEAAFQLVMDGLKLQPCRPTFVQGRDAILAADEATYGGAYQCYIWHAFARRGVGVNAIDGSGTLGVTEEFSMPESCTPAGCFVAPRFAGADVVRSTGTPEACELTVGWSPAELLCANATQVTYTVYRSTDPGFEPGPENQVASGLTTESYVDTDVESGVRYFYVVRATDDIGNTDVNKKRRSEVPVGDLSPGGSFFDDSGDTTRQQFAPAPTPLNSWTVRESDPADGNLTRHYASNASGTDYPLNACVSLESETIYLGAAPTLSFETSWLIEPGYDGAIVEVATADGDFQNWTKLDSLPYPGLMTFDGACPNPGFAEGEAVFNGFQPAPLPLSGSLAEYANQAVRIRFILASDPGLAFPGWVVDNVRIDDTMIPGSCSGGGGGGGCHPIDDADEAVEYKTGWHRVKDPAASGGGYHRRMGNNGNGKPHPTTRVVFEATSVTYRFVKTDKGGTADVFLDGSLVDTLDYYSPSTSYDHSVTYDGLSDGTHELVVEQTGGAVTVDGFDFGCSGAEGADAEASESGSLTLVGEATGLVARVPVQVGPNHTAISIVVEGSALPLSVKLLDPVGLTVATGGALIEGLSASGLDAVPAGEGTYTVEVLNPANDTLWVSVALDQRR